MRKKKQPELFKESTDPLYNEMLAFFPIGTIFKTSYETGPFELTHITPLCTCAHYMDELTYGFGEEAPQSIPHFHFRAQNSGKKHNKNNESYFSHYGLVAGKIITNSQPKCVTEKGTNLISQYDEITIISRPAQEAATPDHKEESTVYQLENGILTHSTAVKIATDPKEFKAAIKKLPQAWDTPHKERPRYEFRFKGAIELHCKECKKQFLRNSENGASCLINYDARSNEGTVYYTATCWACSGNFTTTSFRIFELKPTPQPRAKKKAATVPALEQKTPVTVTEKIMASAPDLWTPTIGLNIQRTKPVTENTGDVKTNNVYIVSVNKKTGESDTVTVSPRWPFDPEFHESWDIMQNLMWAKYKPVMQMHVAEPTPKLATEQGPTPEGKRLIENFSDKDLNTYIQKLEFSLKSKEFNHMRKTWLPSWEFATKERLKRIAKGPAESLQQQKPATLEKLLNLRDKKKQKHAAPSGKTYTWVEEYTAGKLHNDLLCTNPDTFIVYKGKTVELKFMIAYHPETRSWYNKGFYKVDNCSDATTFEIKLHNRKFGSPNITTSAHDAVYLGIDNILFQADNKGIDCHSGEVEQCKLICNEILKHEYPTIESLTNSIAQAQELYKSMPLPTLNPLTPAENNTDIAQQQTATQPCPEAETAATAGLPAEQAGTAISYPGSKHSAGIWQKHINQITPHDVWVSGFLGKCAVTYYKRPAQSNFGIDLNLDALQQFWDARTDVKRERQDFITWIEQFNFSKSTQQRWFIYLDPPYLMSTRRSGADIYKYELTAEQHAAIIAWAIRTTQLSNVHIAIAHYPCAEYDELLNHGWRKITYTTSTHQGPVDECLYMNYPEPEELHEYTYLGDNRTDRQNNNRMATNIVKKLKKLPALRRNKILAEVTQLLQQGSATPPR